MKNNLSKKIMQHRRRSDPPIFRRALYGTLVAIFFTSTVPDIAEGQMCANGIPANQSDSLALVALYNATDGPNWRPFTVGGRWLQGPVISWGGISGLNQDCRVRFLSLTRLNLRGMLPDKLGELSEATTIGISDNSGMNGDLRGPIPTTFGNLKKLEILSLGRNNLSGEIPATLGDLPNLISLHLSQNQLTGSIPPALGKLGNLEILQFSSNKLSGAIPAELGDLNKLRDLALSFNQLSGTIPVELSKLINLGQLDLVSNQLSGKIPPDLGKLMNLGNLELSSNQLSGAIPAALGNLNNLAILRLNSNQLSGEIPVALGNLANLQLLWLDNNQLSGPIPPELGKLTNLQFDLNLSNNQLSGAIPAELGKLTKLQTLNLSLNQLTGDIPADLSKLTNLLSLSLSNNKLTGAVPPSFASLTKLTGLFLQSNQLEDLPNLTGLSALRNLFLENNRFTFEDLEPNAPLFSRATVRYSPQAEVETDARSMGRDVLLSVNVGGQNNVYQWFKDGQTISGATVKTYSVQNADLNSSSQYHCQITNTLVTGLTIRSRRISLQQVSFVVNSAGDQSDPTPNDGVCDVDPNLPGDQCTLRAAIETINAMGAANAANTVARPVAFNISGNGVPIIRPPADLPAISSPVIIDGTTQTAGRVRLAGAGGSNLLGLFIRANGCMIRGIVFDGFTAGLSISANGNTVEENSLVGNQRGILLSGDDNIIRKNVVANNVHEGIYIFGELSSGATGNTIADNLIGTEDGIIPMPSPNGIGVLIDGKFARQNTIRNNLVSGNKIGIKLFENSNNTVEGNRIGTTADGQFPLGNDAGIILEKSEKNIIKNNVIARSKQSGVFVLEGSGNVIEGNKIGTDASGAAALGNDEHGIEIESAFENLVKDNVISGNKGAGVFISGLLADLNTIENNKIGTNAAGTEPLGNGMEGVRIQDVTATNVLANLISANGKSGVVIEGNEAFNTVVLTNRIGTDIFENDVLGVMGNREHGVVIDGAPSSTLEDNRIAFNHGSGILLLQAPSGTVARNNIRRNMVGIDILGGSELNIIGNRIHLNVTNIRAGNAAFIAQNNDVFDGTGPGTGIHLTRSRAVIRGNNLTGDAGNAITLEQGSTALIMNNNIWGNRGLGVSNLDRSVSIAAQRNWWGNASGPGGAGPGSGDKVSANVNFANWLARPVAIVAAAESDTVILVAGKIDTVSVFLQNWQKPNDVLNVRLSDSRGWLQEPKIFSVTLADSLGAETKITFAIPGGISDGSADRVQVIATSRANPNAADTTIFTVVSEMAMLVSIRVVPDSVTLAPGDSVQFTASGLDQFGGDFSFTPVWSATGGAIDASGLYIAGNRAGTFLVTAAAPNTQVRGQAAVRINATVGVEEDAAVIPTAFHLYQNYPNPFNPGTRFQYDLPKSTHVRLDIYNTLGQRIRTLVDEQKPAGTHKIIWDGQTDNGKAVAAGIYIYRLQANTSSGRIFVQSRKLVFVR